MRRATAIAFLSGVLTNQGVMGGWIDEDTPAEKRLTTSFIDGSEYKLVMSDEFNVEGRTFADGDDPTWTALDKSDDDSSAAGGGSQHFYNSTMITTTSDGMLKIASIVEKTKWKHFDTVNQEYREVTKNFKSGMLQSWNKFCFTGGIVEVDVILPGDPYIGGLWPAIWLLGNLGRATYEASTNNIWPWSYNSCNRKKQQAQTISACNTQNHYGLNQFQGRGATEIDIIEMMTGDAVGPLPATDPPVSYPYADFTLQVAPGIEQNRPQSGSRPVREPTISKSGFTEWKAQSWYDGLEFNGNTTLNPFFYGTYMAETKPEEPVARNKKQVFQADAVGAMHQLVASHFRKKHTFRLEWQPGPGGRLDWFTKDYKVNSTFSMTGDGNGNDWVHAYGIKDQTLENITGAQIPVEPSSLIMNTAISSTWGFPWDVKETCAKCYDCKNVTCQCSFYPGFCNMMEKSKVAMYIDYIRVYQSDNDDAHVGEPHMLGCDPVEYPTKEFIKGHEYRYMRTPPFGYDDKKPLKEVKSGGGSCKKNSDCGGVDQPDSPVLSDSRRDSVNDMVTGRGVCIEADFSTGFFGGLVSESRCQCNEEYTGPNCLAMNKHDDEPGALELRSQEKIFENLPTPTVPFVLVLSIAVLMIGLVITASQHVKAQKKEIDLLNQPGNKD